MSAIQKKKQQTPKIESLFWLLTHRANWGSMTEEQIINTLVMAKKFDEQITQVIISLKKNQSNKAY